MNKGFVILADNVEARRAACACAYSIKSSNRNASVSMIVPNLKQVEKVLEEPFDSIIELPFHVASNRRANDWQLYWSTPYEYTIAIDAYSLIKNDLTTTWDYLIEHHDLCFGHNVNNFKGIARHLLSDAYDTHKLTYVNSNIFYFKKDTDIALSFFKLADPYMRDWRDALKNSIKAEYVPVKYDSDLMQSIILQGIGAEQDVIPFYENILKSIDMRTANREFSHRVESSWLEYLNVWPSKNAKVKIQNFAITDTLFYTDSKFLTEEIFNEHRDYFRYLQKETNLVD